MVLCLSFKQLKASAHDYLKYHSNNIIIILITPTFQGIFIEYSFMS